MDGRIDRAMGVITGNNTPKRVLVAEPAEPGGQHLIAVLVANAPLGCPVGAIFFRHATLAFEEGPRRQLGSTAVNGGGGIGSGRAVRFDSVLLWRTAILLSGKVYGKIGQLKILYATVERNRWDCSDWQPRPAVADAEDELASSILETLAANRGKTLYCALDQSDTWTKRQVYDNAHRHNDRDRTQYDGSQGQGRFRGFTAGQEGWLTDGEHGITGVSPERIFEFPQQERVRRRTRTIKFDVGSGPAETWDANYCFNHHQQTRSGEDPTPNGTLICSELGSWHGGWSNSWTFMQRDSRNRYAGHGSGFTNWQFDWRTRAVTGTWNTDFAGGNTLSEDGWKDKAELAATAECKARGVKYVRGSADFVPVHNRDRGGTTFDKGPNHGWFFAVNPNTGDNRHSIRKARESRTWTATCSKRVRGSRR